MKIVVDIETIPEQNPDMSKYREGITAPGQYKKPESIQKWLDENADAMAEEKWLKTSLDGTYGQICCIGAKAENGETLLMAGNNERDILALFWSWCDDQLIGREPMFIAHNAKFDLPFLFHRSVINGTKPVRGFKPHGKHGYSHYCTMEAWAGYNGRIGLDRLAKALGLGGKTEGFSGADVWPAYQKGDFEKIAGYCIDDVLLTEQVYNRLTFGE